MKSDIDELELKVGKLDCLPMRIKLSNLIDAHDRLNEEVENLEATKIQY